MRRHVMLIALLAASTGAAATPPPAPAIASVQVSKSTLAGGNSLLIGVTLTQPAPFGGVSVGLTYSNTSVLANPPKGITIANGQASATVALATTPTATSVAVVVTGTAGTSSANATVTVRPPQLQSASIASVVQGGTVADLDVTLDGPAPPGGALIDVSFSPSILSIVPSSFTVTLPGPDCTFDNNTVSVSCTQTHTITDSANILTVIAGSTSKAIRVLAPAVRDDRAVTGTVSFGTSKPINVTVRRPRATAAVVSSCDMNSPALTGIAGPASLQLRVHTFDRVAKSGAYVTISGRTPTPPPINVELSQLSGSNHLVCFPVALPAVSQPSSHAWMVTSGTTSTATIRNVPLTVQGVVLSSDSVMSGTNVTATITMSADVGTDATIQVSSTGSSVPQSVVVPQGARTAVVNFVARVPLSSVLPVIRQIISATYLSSTKSDTVVVSR